MAVYCYERYQGISGTVGKEHFVGYVVHGTSDSGLAVSHVYAESPPAVVSGSVVLYRQPFQIKDQGGGVWHADVDYKPADSEDDKKNDDDQATPLAFKLSWDTGGGSVKITESLEVVDGGGIWQDTGRVIGWDGKKVNGCEIIIPQLVITVDVFYAPQTITHAAVTAWARATGKVNNDTWLNFEPGEVLHLGNNGEQTFSMLNGRATKPAPVSFKVSCSENIPAPFTVKGDPDLVANGGKDGWDYLDVFYGEKVVGAAPNQITVALPERFKIHRVYPRTSFRAFMGIG